MQTRQDLADRIVGHFWARAIQTAAFLDLPDLVASGVNTTAALEERTGIDAWRMGRFLRILSALGLFTRTGDTYSLTDLGKYLQSDAEDTLYHIAKNNYYLFEAFTELEAVLRTGEPGYLLSSGRKHFDAMQDMPDFARSFDLAMNAMFVPETKVLINSFDFGRFSHLVDVGGGNGEVMIRALQANPDLSGTILDLPHVAERASARLDEAGLSDRATAIGADFFAPLPVRAEAILLRHIIHDWTESEALAILKTCRDALEPDGRLLIAEALIEDADQPTLPIRLDLAMMTYYNGAERTLDEYHALTAKAGLEIIDVTTITPALSVMECRAI